MRTEEERQVKLKQQISSLEENLIKQQGKCFDEMNQRKQAESKMKEEIIRAENAELSLAQGGIQLVNQLERKILDLKEELEIERRRTREAIQISKQMERNCSDLKFQCEEEKRNYEYLEVEFSLFIIS